MANLKSNNTVVVEAPKPGLSFVQPLLVTVSVLRVVAVFVGQAITASGNPDPLTK